MTSEEIETNRRDEIAEHREGTARRGTTPPPVQHMKAVAREFEFTVDPEFHALVPPLTTDEYEQLEANLIANGCRDPLVVWNDIIVDGHNRYEICKRNNIIPYVVTMDFADRDEAKVWIIRNQFGRRNLSNYQRAELASLLEPLIAKKAKENQRLSEGRGQKGLPKSVNLKPVNRQKELAKIAGVSHDTIYKAKVIASEASEETKAQLREGKTTIGKVFGELRPVRSTKKRAKPDFKKISPKAGMPKLGHSTGELPIPVSLPQDPKKAHLALSYRFSREFLVALAQDILKGPPAEPKPMNEVFGSILKQLNASQGQPEQDDKLKSGDYNPATEATPATSDTTITSAEVTH